MSTRRFIHWRPDIGKKDGKMFANVHLLVGYNQRHITDYQAMAEELRKTFPEATDDEIECSFVTKSDCVKGFSLIAWNEYIPEGKYPDWEQPKTVEYYW